MSSTTPGPKQGVKWGDFLDKFKEYGVALVEIKDVEVRPGEKSTVRYVRREFQGEILTCPVPEDWSPDRRMGTWMMLHVCGRLRLPSNDVPLIL